MMNTSYCWLLNFSMSTILIYNESPHNIQLLDEAEQNIVIYQWRADQLFADAEGRGK